MRKSKGVAMIDKGSPPGKLAAADLTGWTGRLGLVSMAAAAGEVLASLIVQRVSALEESRTNLSLALACTIYLGVDFARRWWTDTRHREVRG